MPVGPVLSSGRLPAGHGLTVHVLVAWPAWGCEPSQAVEVAETVTVYVPGCPRLRRPTGGAGPTGRMPGGGMVGRPADPYRDGRASYTS